MHNTLLTTLRLVAFWVATAWAVNTTAAPVGPVTDSHNPPNKVAEDASIGTPVRITAEATDPDPGDTVSYSLSNNAGGRFAIDATSGMIYVASTLDYETATSHSVTVLATSTDTSTSSASFTIKVTNVNEPIGPIIDVDPAGNILAENAAASTLVGITALAIDEDSGDSVSYSVADARFSIDAGGVIRVASGASFNAATEGTINLAVTAMSTDTSTSNAVFNITVLEVAEPLGPVTDVDPAANAPRHPRGNHRPCH